MHRLESLNAYVGCPVPDASHEGQFLICDGCGGVAEFAAPAIGQAIAEQAARQRFTVAGQTVEVRGTCRSCDAGA